MKMIHPLLLQTALIGLLLVPALAVAPWVHGADAVVPVPTVAATQVVALKPGNYKLARAVPMEILEGTRIAGKTELSPGVTVKLVSVEGDKGLIRFGKDISGYISLKPEEGLFVGVGQGVAQSGSSPKSGQALMFMNSENLKLAAQTGHEPERGQAGIVPGLNLKMRYIRPGTFAMGSPPDEAGREASNKKRKEDPDWLLALDIRRRNNEPPWPFDDETQHNVKLTRGYWLGATAVTQGQYKMLMGKNAIDHRAVSLREEADLQVKCTWDEAIAFCQKLTERESAAGLLPVGYTFTLPTEAQWEYACRAGTTGPYAGDLNAMAWNDLEDHPVGTKQSNAWGLFDMSGNFPEWCLDWYGNYPRDDVTDPTGPPSGTFRVFRGNNNRSADRAFFEPDQAAIVGFRVALNLAQNDTETAKTTDAVGPMGKMPAKTWSTEERTLAYNNLLAAGRKVGLNSKAEIDNFIGVSRFDWNNVDDLNRVADALWQLDALGQMLK